MSPPRLKQETSLTLTLRQVVALVNAPIGFGCLLRDPFARMFLSASKNDPVWPTHQLHELVEELLPPCNPNRQICL